MQETWKTEYKTATSEVVAGPGILKSVSVVGGAATDYVLLRDTDGSGAILWAQSVGSSGEISVPFATALYFDKVSAGVVGASVGLIASA
jgi:hypothetical protein